MQEFGLCIGGSRQSQYFKASKNVPQRRQNFTVRAASDSLTTGQNVALIGGAIFNPVVLFSEWTLFSTGKGLDPGPAGIYGALEGIGKSSFCICKTL